MFRVVRCLSVALLVAGGSAVGLPAAMAADGAMLRLAHLSPDTPAVDVYVDSVADPDAGVVLAGVGYGTISDYQGVAPGTYTVAMRAAGDDPATPPVLSTTVEVGPDTARTVAGVGYFADLGLKVLEDDLALPPSGQARMRVVAAAAGARTLDVSRAEGLDLASGLEFAAATEYVDIPAGRTGLRVAADGGTATELPFEVAAGSVYSVLVLDQPGGGLAVRTVLDAAGPGVVPVGGVETGGGGTAPTSAGTPGPASVAALGIAALAATVLIATGRDRLPRRGTPRHGRSS